MVYYNQSFSLGYSFNRSNYDSTITHLLNTLKNISSWVTATLLTLVPAKTEFFLIGKLPQYRTLSLLLPLNHSTRNLGFIHL